MKKSVKRLLVALFAVLIMVTSSISVFAEVPYDSYTYWTDVGTESKAVYSRPMYSAKFSIDYVSLGITPLEEIRDITVDSEGNLYILDAKSRIVILDKDYNFVSEIGLIGEESYNDAKGVFFGLSAKHTRAEMIRSIMEGVVFSLNDALNLIENLGVTITQVRASGGGGKNPLWRQMQADIFNKEVATVKSSEGPALGVALLAGVGAGIYSSVPAACKEAVLIKTTQNPDEKAVAEYKKYSGLFDELYPALKEKYKRLTEILNN